MLYLDSDLIIKRCISQLFDTELNQNCFAGVNDSVHYDYNRKFGTPRDAPHINAGVMLISLSHLKDMPFSSRIDSFIRRKKYLITLGDQQILNGEFYREITLLPLEWNVHGSVFDAKWRKKWAGVKNNYSEEEMIAASADPWIIHYTYRRKPWTSLEHPRAHEWVEVAMRTSFFENHIFE